MVKCPATKLPRAVYEERYFLIFVCPFQSYDEGLDDNVVFFFHMLTEAENLSFEIFYQTLQHRKYQKRLDLSMKNAHNAQRESLCVIAVCAVS